jgi:putative multiple sugar transport system permease protein
MPAFIVTLAGMLLFRGLTYLVTNVNPVSFKNDGYSLLATGILDEIMGITNRIGPYRPMAIIAAIIILGIFFIAEFASRRKKFANGFEVAPIPLFMVKLVLISLLVLGLADRFARYRGLPVIALVL